jgi:hypothetical protein
MGTPLLARARLARARLARARPVAVTAVTAVTAATARRRVALTVRRQACD